jgi:hypothetical protein
MKILSRCPGRDSNRTLPNTSLDPYRYTTLLGLKAHQYDKGLYRGFLGHDTVQW